MNQITITDLATRSTMITTVSSLKPTTISIVTNEETNHGLHHCQWPPGAAEANKLMKGQDHCIGKRSWVVPCQHSQRTLWCRLVAPCETRVVNIAIEYWYR